MEQAIIKQLDKKLKCNEIIIKKEQIILKVSSTEESVKCPYCGKESTKVHSRYQREIQDIPIQEKQTILLLETRKMFCTNVACKHTTFAESFDFVPVKGKKTNRLIQKILLTSTKMSSVGATALLKADAIKTCKSSICDLLKKMPAIVDKSCILKVCVDDFAFRKRYSYGTVMVNLEDHRIIDILDSRDTKDVEKWLKTYPNLQVIARDGAQTYASASANAHPDAMQALSDTRNRAERIRFSHKKRKEGYTLNDIALLLHSSVSTIKKYLMIPEGEIPESKDISREKQHKQAIKKKQQNIDEVRKLYSEGHSIDEITRITGHVQRTVIKYLREDCYDSNGHYDQRFPGKLYPYEQDVIQSKRQIRWCMLNVPLF